MAAINMPTPQKAILPEVMATIAQGLQAAHNYYGIDTEKQQQALQAAQLTGENLRNQEAQLNLNEAQNMAAGKPGIPTLLKHGYQPSMLKQAIESPTPSQNQGVQAGGGPAPTPTVASNDAITSDAAAPRQPIPKISDFAAGSTPQSPIASAAGLIPVTTTEGTTVYMQPGPELLKKNADLNKTLLENQKLQTEMTNKPSEMAHTYEKDFDSEAKDLRNAIQTAKQTSASILSGNKVQEQLGAFKNTLEQLGIKRGSGSLEDLGLPQGTADKISAYIAKKSTGHMNPDDLNEINQGIQSFMQSQESNLTSLAADHAARMQANLGIPVAEAVTKHLLPNGTGAQYTPTRVVTSDNGMTKTLQKQTKNGNWSDVTQEGTEISPLTAAVRTGVGLGGDIFHGIAGKVRGLFGGGE